MPFSFPASPSIGDVSQQNGRSYTYAGSNVWELTAPSGNVSDGNKGDITVSSSAATWTINNPPIHPFVLMGG